MNKKLKNMILSKLNTIDSMIYSIEEDLESVTNKGLRQELLKMLLELRISKSALTIKLNNLTEAAMPQAAEYLRVTDKS